MKEHASLRLPRQQRFDRWNHHRLVVMRRDLPAAREGEYRFRHVRHSFPQRRNRNGQHVQSVVKVFPEIALRDFLHQVALTRRLDLTDASLHTLSPETSKILSKIQDKVTITYYSSERAPAGLQNLQSMLESERTTWRQHVEKLKDELANIRSDDRSDLSAMLMDVAKRLGDSNSDG